MTGRFVFPLQRKNGKTPVSTIQQWRIQLNQDVPARKRDTDPDINIDRALENVAPATAHQ
jgi:hypothetical protein